LAVIEECNKNSHKHRFLYVSSIGGMEASAIKKFQNIEVKEIVCGKLRRYFSFKNFVDFFKIPVGFFQSVFAVSKFSPDFVFGKGGYVSVPVVIAASFINIFRNKENKIRIFIHESDVVPGLANKICARFADYVFVSFEESKKYFPKKILKNISVTGNPIRKTILTGEQEKGFALCKFNRFKPVILAMGGSLGAMQINNLVWDNLDEILKKYQVVHITGKGHLKFGLKKNGYAQFELLFDELKDVYATSSIVVTRAGANSLAEIASLGKKAVIIPLGKAASRGDQIINAKVCAREYGWSMLLGDVTSKQFMIAIDLAASSSFPSGTVLHKSASKTICKKILEKINFNK